MERKTAIALLGVLGAGALGYYVYQRSRGTQPIFTAPPGTNLPASQQPTQTALSAYEGKGFRNTDNGMIYKVVGGVLRYLTTPKVMLRELGSSNYKQLVQAGIITQVNTSFINQFTTGPALNGFGSVFNFNPAI